MRHYTKENFSVEQSIGYMLTKSRNLLTAELDAALKDLGITSAQMGILLSLSRSLARTPLELSKLLAIDTGLMTRMLDKLERQALLERRPSEEDGRVTHLLLTAEGQRTAEAVSGIAPEVLNTRLQGFTRAEFAELKRLLTKLSQ